MRFHRTQEAFHRGKRFIARHFLRAGFGIAVPFDIEHRRQRTCRRQLAADGRRARASQASVEPSDSVAVRAAPSTDVMYSSASRDSVTVLRSARRMTLLVAPAARTKL